MTEQKLFKFLHDAWYGLIIVLYLGLNIIYERIYDIDSFLVYAQTLYHYIEEVDPQGWPLHFWFSLPVFVLGIVLIVFKNPFADLVENTQTHGSARWAKFRDIKKAGFFAKNGIVLGKWREKTLHLAEPLSVLLLAPPGTGKSAGVAIPSLFNIKHSVVVLDVKGELFQTTSKYRGKIGEVVKFSPGLPNSSRWNPLSKENLPKRKEGEKSFSSNPSVGIIVQRVASTIFPEPTGAADKHWTLAARGIFIAITLALIEENGETTFREVYEKSLVDDTDISRKEHIAMIGQTQNLKEVNAKLLNAYENMGDNQFSGEISSFDTGLQVFQDDNVRDATSATDIDFKTLRGIKNQPLTIYFIVGTNDIERLRPLIQLFFESLSSFLLATKVDKKKDLMVTLILDEFPRLGKMTELINMPALSRGQWANSVIIAQDINQIEETYGKNSAESIFSTTAVKIIPSLNSLPSAKKISDTIGHKTVTLESSSHQNTKVFGSNISKSESGKPLISPQKLMSLKEGDCVIVRQFSSEIPIKVKMNLWFKDKRMKKISGEIEDENVYRPGQNKTSEEINLDDVNADLEDQEIEYEDFFDDEELELPENDETTGARRGGEKEQEDDDLSAGITPLKTKDGLVIDDEEVMG